MLRFRLLERDAQGRIRVWRHRLHAARSSGWPAEGCGRHQGVRRPRQSHSARLHGRQHSSRFFAAGARNPDLHGQLGLHRQNGDRPQCAGPIGFHRHYQGPVRHQQWRPSHPRSRFRIHSAGIYRAGAHPDQRRRVEGSRRSRTTKSFRLHGWKPVMTRRSRSSHRHAFTRNWARRSR
jgi:hypothetical protein